MKVEEYMLPDGSSPYKKWFDGIGEYKIDWGPGYRIYLAQDGKELIILFGGGTKKKQNTDIKEAKRLHQEYKTRKSAKLKIEKGNSKSDENKNSRGKS